MNIKIRTVDDVKNDLRKGNTKNSNTKIADLLEKEYYSYNELIYIGKILNKNSANLIGIERKE